MQGLIPSLPAPWPDHASKDIRCDDEGFVLGADTPLVRRTADGRFAIERDGARCLALLSVVGDRAVSADILASLEAAAIHWTSGDKALANLRLVFAGLPRLTEPVDVYCLQAAGYCLDEGLPPRELMKALDLDPSVLSKFDPAQPRVPAGNGRESGRWRRIWDDVIGWLEEPVPEYDTDTGAQVGTRSRARAIAANPLTVGIAGTATLLSGEAAAAAVAALSAPVTRDDIIAALPEGMIIPELGRLAGFSQGLEASSQASVEATPEIISRLQSAGITREAISLTRRFYAAVARDNPQNVSGAQRATLLKNILKVYPK